MEAKTQAESYHHVWRLRDHQQPCGPIAECSQKRTGEQPPETQASDKPHQQVWLLRGEQDPVFISERSLYSSMEDRGEEGEMRQEDSSVRQQQQTDERGQR